jgi:3',5'-cyclic AMP phosphodiesterase CpdA
VTSSTAVRFGAFADAHYADRLYGDRHCRDSLAKLTGCVERLAGAELDFAVCLGDLIDSGPGVGAEPGYARAMADVFARFPGPRHWVLGNHDVSALSKAQFLQACGSKHPACYSFDVRGVHFVILDGNCHSDGTDFRAGAFDWADAWVAPAQVEWLAADLATASDRPALILCHENLDHRLWQESLDPHVARNAAAVRQALESSGRVAAVLQAHYHPGLVTIHNGIPYIGLRAMVVGPGIGNNAFAVVCVDPAGGLSVEGHGQQPSWRAGPGSGA